MVLLKRIFLIGAFILCGVRMHAFDTEYMEWALGFSQIPERYCICVKDGVSPVKYMAMFCCSPIYACHTIACEKNWERICTMLRQEREKAELNKMD